MNQTKRILALALALVMVFATCSVLAVAAAEAVATAQKGDVNQNGKIDMTDYILVKRQYFNTFKLTDEQLDLADVNNNGKIDMTDYILVKRMYFGTYTLPVVPEEPSEDTSEDVSEDVSEPTPDASEDTSVEAPVVSEDEPSDAPVVSEDEPSVPEEPSKEPTPDEVDPEVSEPEVSEPEVSEPEEPELGTFENPYLVELNAMRPTAVYVPAGGEVYVKASDANGTTLTVGYATNANYQIYYGRMPVMPEGEDNTCSIEMQSFQDFVTVMNPSEEDVVLYFALTEGAIGDTTGTMDNPKELVLEDSYGALRAFDDVALESGNQGYWYTVTAPAEGMIYVQINTYDDNYNDLGWMYCVNNITAGKYGDNHWSDDEDAVNYEFVAVSEGDVIQIFASTYDPADPWTAPAGNVSVNISFVEYGSADAPFTAVLGDNTAAAKEGSQGVYYTYTAEQDGTLVVTMPEGDWVYCVNNLTSYIYGDTQWSDSDPVVYAFEIAVNTGDEIQIMVNTYDPANPWTAPAGEIVWNLDYKAVVLENLALNKTYTYSSDNFWLQSWCQTGTAPDTVLTNGFKGGVNYYTAEYLGWNTPDYAPVEIIVDLNCIASVSKFTLGTMAGTMGIACPSDVTIAVSTDNATWTDVNTAVDNVETTLDSGWGDIGLTNRLTVLTADDAVEARYVKFTVTPTGLFIWAEEIEVFGTLVSELPSATEDEAEPDVSEPDVSEPEVSEPEVSEPEVSEPEVSEPEVSEPEVSEPEVSEPEVSEPEVSEPETSEPETSEPDEPVVNPASNVVTLWNNTGYEGDSNNVVIYTDASVYANTQLKWWRHIAFAPVEGKDGIYVVTAITTGDAGGSGGDNCLDIPEGGFVWCAFEWPTAGAGAYSIEIMNGLSVGDYVEVTGIDPVAGTNTADADIKEWVDPNVPHVVSIGASYTASTTNYYTLDGQGISTMASTALTDGKKGSPDFWKASHVGYQGLAWSTGVEITLDLGATYTLSSFTATCAGGVWGIGVPEVGATLTKISVYDEETSSWVDVDVTVSGVVEEKTSSWGDTIKVEEITFTVNGEPVVASQVKFTLSAWGSLLIVEELEAIGY